MTDYPKNILNKVFLYTARQLDIIFGIPNKIFPTVNRAELSILINKCCDLGDDDSLSLIMNKYDVDAILDVSTDVIMPEEDVKKSRRRFLVFCETYTP